MLCKIFKIIHFKYPAMKVLCLIFFLSYSSAGPVPSEKNFYSQFIDYLNNNKCHMPNEIELPFPESEISWEYLSVPLRECQTPQALKPGEEVFMLCNEIFESLKNITCSNASIHLSRGHEKFYAKLSDKVCEDFKNLEALVPEKENYLGHRLVDGVICKIICASELKSLCTTLLWSYETQKQIADALRNERSALKNQESIEINDGLKSEPLNPQVKKSDKAEDKILPDNEADNVIQPELEPHLSQEVTANKTKKLMEPLKPEQMKKSNIMPMISTSNVTNAVNVTHLQNLSSDVSDKKGSQNTVDHQLDAGKQNVTLKEKANQVNEINGKKGKEDINEGHPVINNDSGEINKMLLLPKAKSKNVADAENEINKTNIQQKKFKEEKINSAKVISGVQKQPLNNIHDITSTQNIGSSTNLISKSSDNLIDSSTKNTVSVPDKQTIISKTDSHVGHVPDSDLIQEKKVLQSSESVQSHKITDPVTKNLKGVSVETNSKLIPESTTVEVALENMETGNEVNQHPDKDLEQYNDLENNEGEEGEYSRSDYDGALYQPSKSKDPDTKLTVPVGGPNDEVRSRDDVFLMKNTVGRVPDDIQMIPSFPEQEDSHFFFYFLSIVLILMAGYLIFHNKQKIIALIVEGRHERRRRSHGVGYKKLETK